MCIEIILKLRKYLFFNRTLVLVNGLHVLLVSDPSPVPHDGMTSSGESTADSCAEESTESEDENASGSSSGEDSDSYAESEEGS